MNVENLRSTYHQLLGFMTDTGYSKNYVRFIERTVEFIVDSSTKWESYDELLTFYSEEAISKKDYTKRKAVLNVIASFDYFGVLPGTRADAKYLHKISSYDYLNPVFKSLVDEYSANADRNHKKETTIRNECWNASSFLLSMQKSEIQSLEQITEEDVLAVLTDEFGYPSKSASFNGQITAVFKKLAEHNCECKRILLYIPKMRRHRKNVQYLTPDERAKVKTALKETDNSLSLRDRAIGHLLYFTGLRCCDISNLRFSDIDLDNEIIYVIQQKTEVPLKLSLSTIVGNAIYDYVAEGRIESDSPYIFLSCNHQYGKLKPGSIGVIANQIYDNAKIRLNSADRRGGHLFRHTFATAMLENGVSRVVISNAMGHNSPTSVETYLSADMVHLKECSLSIEEFPIRKEVLCNG